MAADDLAMAITTVSHLTGLPASTLVGKACDAPNTYYVYQPIRGGIQLVVGADGSVLFGASVIAPDNLIAEYSAGRRTDPAKFADMRRRNQAASSADGRAG